jgi:hypothetical protein
MGLMTPEERKKARNASQRKWNHKNKDKLQAYWRDRRRAETAKRYGLTREEYEAFRQQPCAICGKLGRTVVDHDHATGRVRGPLCIEHNAMLGMAHDNPFELQAAIEYLRRTSSSE